MREKIAEVQTIPLSDELNVDIAPDGKIYGIELMNANEQINIEKESNLILVNEAVGQIKEISLGGLFHE